MNTNIEQVVLKNILTNEKYMRKVLPFVKPDYFEGIYKILFKEAGKFVGQYKNLPTAEAFKIEIDNADSFNEEQYRHAVEIIPNLFEEEKADEAIRASNDIIQKTRDLKQAGEQETQ